MGKHQQTGKVMKRKHPFMILDVTPFRDTRLSWKAKGLMTYFLDKPDGWEFNLEHIYKQAPDGRTSVNSGIKELKKYGYIVRVAFRKNNKIDRYDFLVYEQPVAYPTEKDLHIDLEKWEKHLKNGGDLDITLFAENLKPAKPRIKPQVSENLQTGNQDPDNQRLISTKDINHLNNQSEDCLIDSQTKKEAEKFISYSLQKGMTVKSVQATRQRYLEAREKGVKHETLINSLDETHQRYGENTSPISVIQSLIANRIAEEEAEKAAMAEAKEKERKRKQNAERLAQAMIAAGLEGEVNNA